MNQKRFGHLNGFRNRSHDDCETISGLELYDPRQACSHNHKSEVYAEKALKLEREYDRIVKEKKKNVLECVEDFFCDVFDAVSVLESKVELVVFRNVVETVLATFADSRQFGTALSAASEHVDLNVLAQLLSVLEPVVLHIVAVRNKPSHFALLLRIVVDKATGNYFMVRILRQIPACVGHESPVWKING